MRIELDKAEYESLQKTSYNQGYKDGYVEAGTFVMCKKDPNWKKGDLHMKTKSSGDYCLVCEAKKEFENKPAVSKQKLRDEVGKIFIKKFPSKSKDRQKGMRVYSDVVAYLERELKL